MSKEAKLIRGQLRQIFQEEAPNVLNTELASLIYKRVFQHVDSRLDFIAKNAQAALDKMQERQKDMQNMLLRQYSAPINVQAPAPQPEEKKTDEKEEQQSDTSNI